MVQIGRLLLVMIALVMHQPDAEAASCKVTGFNVIPVPSASVTVHSGTFTTAQVLPLTMTFALTTASGVGSGCNGLALKVSSAAPTLKLGLLAIPYSVLSSGSTITYSATPLAFAPITVGTATQTISLGLSIPSGTYAVGTYIDTVIANVFDTGTTTSVAGPVAITLILQILNTSCTIGSSASGGSQTLDFSNTSAASPSATITTAQKFATFGTVTCNNSATMTLTSANGAAKNASPGTTSHQNFFDYTVTTTVNGGTVTLDTSANPAVSGPETATGSISAPTTTGAPLSIGVTPVSPVKPLIAGSYADVLTLTISPN